MRSNHTLRMKRFGVFILATAGIGLAFASTALADVTLSVGSINPGTTVFAKNTLSFHVTAAGFYPTGYQLTDSDSTSTVSFTDLSNAGTFSWTPDLTDIGNHLLTITGSDNDNNTASTTVSITVAPPPSLTVQSVTPGNTVAPGTNVIFSVAAPGFTNPIYLIGDSFDGTSIQDSNISASGNFSWTPDMSQDGAHTITVYASDSLGHQASANVNIQVGAAPSISIFSASSTGTILLGNTIAFTATASGFSPTTYSIADSFPGTTVSNANFSSAYLGTFSWTPNVTDIGTHVLTITGTVGAYGQSATTSMKVRILGPGGVATSSSQNASTTPPQVNSSQSSLQAKLADLQSQIKALSASSSAAHVFNVFIGYGQKGAEVTALQKRLIALGFLSGDATGYFGKLTEAAVKQFQIAHGIRAAGYVGPGTRAALNQH